MGAMVHLALKDLRLLWRDKLGLFWVVGFPLGMALFFGAIFGGGGGGTAAMPVAVADEDGTAGSRAFVEKLSASKSLEVRPLDAATAAEQVRKGDLVAYVRLEKGFGDSLALFGGSDAPIEVGIDPSRRAEAGYLQGLLMQASFESLKSRFADPKAMRERVRKGLEELRAEPATDPHQREVLETFLGNLDQFLGDVDSPTYEDGITFGGSSGGIREVAVTHEDSGPRTYYEVSFPAAISWGLLGCVAAFALSLVKERLTGSMLRLRVAPLSRGQVLAAKGMACFTTCVCAMALMLLFGHVVFHVRLPSLPLLALAACSAACCFVGIMMLLSTLGRTIQAVSGIGWASFVVMEMLGGGTIPLIAMPSWMLKVSSVSPVKWTILALEGAIWRGFSVTEMLLPCGILVAVGATCFALGVWMFRRQG